MSSNANSLNISVLIPRGEVVRNLVYSGALDFLSRKAQLSLLSVSLTPELNQLLVDTGASVHPLHEIDERWLIRIQREIIDIAHGRWLWSMASKERWRLRDLEAKSIRAKVSRLGKKAVGTTFATRIGLSLLSKTERTTSRLFSRRNGYPELFNRIKPALVFNASHIHSRNAIQAVQAAQWLGIKTATFIFSWDNLTSQGRIMLPYDYYLVWNQSLKCQLLEMYDWIDPQSVFVTGSPQFNLHFHEQNHLSREDYCRQIGADPRRPIVLYSTGMANHMPGEPAIVEQIADFLATFSKSDGPQLLVRVYAKDLTGRFDDLRERRPDILFADPIWEKEWLTPKPEDSVGLVNALRHCSLGINVASTISLELCMFDKPVINVGYNPPSVPIETLSYADYYEFDHYKPLVECGAVQVAWSTEQMAQLIKEALTARDSRSVQRRVLIERMFGSTLDGRSGVRVAQTLLQIAQTAN